MGKSRVEGVPICILKRNLRLRINIINRSYCVYYMRNRQPESSVCFQSLNQNVFNEANGTNAGKNIIQLEILTELSLLLLWDSGLPVGPPGLSNKLLEVLDQQLYV